MIYKRIKGVIILHRETIANAYFSALHFSAFSFAAQTVLDFIQRMNDGRKSVPGEK